MKLPSSKDFNLKTVFNRELMEAPEDRDSVIEYISHCSAWIDTEMKKPESEWDIPTLSKTLGKTAAHSKIVGKLDDALSMIETSLSLINQYDLDVKHFVVQSLRWADILRYQKKYEEAEVIFEDMVELTKLHPDVVQYNDFAHQHLGKLYFDLGEFQDALLHFECALKIREQKKDSELLHSTRLAIKMTEEKKAANK